jgi:tRNA1(Val) A37 N6-methylase TrmN6
MSFTGKICPVCHGSGQRPASQRSLELAQQPGKIINLRGRNGVFAGQRAVQGYRLLLQQQPEVDDSSSSTSTSIVNQGELLAALGCGDWRLFQLANGHKLTVDDFICAWVAAEEMRKRGYGLVTTGMFGQLGMEGTDKDASSNNKTLFHHADIGCGCGSVLMTLAWAFPEVIRSHGVEAQAVSFDLCRRGLQWNLGVDGSSPLDHTVQLSHADLRTWSGGSLAPYDLITGTPPYFPADRFVASANHSQKIRCRIPTRGAAADYVAAAARLIKPNNLGVICIVETARPEGEQGMRQAIHEHGLIVVRRLDVITRTGLPPRFSCWVLTKPSAAAEEDTSSITKEEARSNTTTHDGSLATTTTTQSQPALTPPSSLDDFPIETLTIRHKDQTRTLEYVDAMETMGWVDFEQTKGKLKQQQD